MCQFLYTFNFISLKGSKQKKQTQRLVIDSIIGFTTEFKRLVKSAHNGSTVTALFRSSRWPPGGRHHLGFLMSDTTSYSTKLSNRVFFAVIVVGNNFSGSKVTALFRYYKMPPPTNCFLSKRHIYYLSPITDSLCNRAHTLLSYLVKTAPTVRK